MWNREPTLSAAPSITRVPIWTLPSLAHHPTPFDVVDLVRGRTQVRIGNPDSTNHGTVDTITDPTGRVVSVS